MIYLAMIVLLMGAEIFGTMLLGTGFLLGGMVSGIVEVFGKKGTIILFTSVSIFLFVCFTADYWMSDGIFDFIMSLIYGF